MHHGCTPGHLRQRICATPAAGSATPANSRILVAHGVTHVPAGDTVDAARRYMCNEPHASTIGALSEVLANHRAISAAHRRRCRSRTAAGAAGRCWTRARAPDICRPAQVVHTRPRQLRGESWWQEHFSSTLGRRCTLWGSARPLRIWLIPTACESSRVQFCVTMNSASK